MIVVAYQSSKPPPPGYDYSYWLTRGVFSRPLLVRLCRLHHQTEVAYLLAYQPWAQDFGRSQIWGYSCWARSLTWRLKLSVRSYVWGMCWYLSLSACRLACWLPSIFPLRLPVTFICQGDPSRVLLCFAGILRATRQGPSHERLDNYMWSSCPSERASLSHFLQVCHP